MASVRPTLVVAAATAGAAVLVALSGGIQSAEASSACTVSDVHNTVRVDASPRDGRVTGGSHLNGTAGYVWFQNVPSFTPLLLVAPDGSTVGPRADGINDIVFADVPLCKTGLWSLLDLSHGDVEATFRTAQDPAGPLDLKTVAIDEPAPKRADRVYEAGHVDQAYAQWEGPTRVYGYPVAEPVSTRVKVSWAFDPSPSWENRDRVRVTVAAEGENQTAITTAETTGGTGSVSAVVDWSSPDAAEVRFMGRGYDDDQYGLETASYERRQVQVLPGSDPRG